MSALGLAANRKETAAPDVPDAPLHTLLILQTVRGTWNLRPKRSSLPHGFVQNPSSTAGRSVAANIQRLALLVLDRNFVPALA